MVAVGGTVVGVAVGVGDEHAENSIMQIRNAPNITVICLFLFSIVVELLAFTFLLRVMILQYVSIPTFAIGFIDYTNAKVFVGMARGYL